MAGKGAIYINKKVFHNKTQSCSFAAVIKNLQKFPSLHFEFPKYILVPPLNHIFLIKTIITLWKKTARISLSNIENKARLLTFEMVDKWMNEPKWQIMNEWDYNDINVYE